MRLLMFLLGATVGAAAMYLYDPSHGSHRRQTITERIRRSDSSPSRFEDIVEASGDGPADVGREPRTSISGTEDTMATVIENVQAEAVSGAAERAPEIGDDITSVRAALAGNDNGDESGQSA